ncbi:MAG: response regulator [Candidatus Margulisiibacteriota bacterium]|nr:MAG: hypothetical protein A2X41_06405 [Candidatus Margulisbacteria bacterium GWE2_39_32]PZM81995.1 MAG: response regulator [Candidatus Margulisiibacteriota bacterium]HCY35884.1 response regulator [Candidatus Margulisiibacteriota bacterium]
MKPQTQYKILIADDETTLRQSLAFVFKKEGYEVFIAVDGEEAIKKAEQISPDLIIIDFSMPNIGGWEAAKKIREIKQCRMTPIIGYTAYSDEESRNQGFANGLNEILQKPLNVDELKAIVADYLSTGSLIKKLN